MAVLAVEALWSVDGDDGCDALFDLVGEAGECAGLEGGVGGGELECWGGGCGCGVDGGGEWC